MTKETYMGIIYDWDDTSLVTLEDLVEGKNIPSRYSREQLLDKDCKDCEDFIRFDYDPFTGEKINWDGFETGIHK